MQHETDREVRPDTTATPLAQLKRQPILLGCIALVVLCATFFAGLASGFGLGRFSRGSLAALPAFSPNNGSAQGRPASAADALDENFDLFWEALDLVYRDYYGEIPDPQTITYDAIRGVVNQLGDPNTAFMTPEEANFFRTSMEGSFEGIGARVEWDLERDTVRIVEPFENQPAWTAGIKRGDLVLEVDGESIVGTNLEDAISKIRGPKNSTVVLTVERSGELELLEFTITRASIEMPTISTDMLGENGDIAYVRLYTFNQNAGQFVRQAVEDALKRNPRALIFDLRGNTGGLLRQAVVVTSIFLEEETVLLERFANGETDVYTTEGRALDTEIPMVVLVNEGSASASEIVAGALQDHQRATLIGATTYGKGSVQLPHTLSDGSIMRVTIARWYTPLDRSIDGTGLTPDILVELSEEERTASVDPQIEAAIEFLENSDQ
jgi:carboxyl-terminal processing protease